MYFLPVNLYHKLARGLHVRWICGIGIAPLGRCHNETYQAMEQSLPWDFLPEGLLCADHASKLDDYYGNR